MRDTFLVVAVKKRLESVYIFRSYRKIKTGITTDGPPCMYYAVCESFIFQAMIERFCSSFKESRSRFNVLTPCFCMILSQPIDRTTSHSAGFYLLFLTLGIFTTRGI